MRPSSRVLIASVMITSAASCSWLRSRSSSEPEAVDVYDPAQVDGDALVLSGTRLSHQTPYIPSQCYTRTQDAGGEAHNPCYACHQSSAAPNHVDDASLQLAYEFPGPARTNPWTNLFVDRSAEVAATKDDEILAYVRESNYVDAAGKLILADRLASLPAGWDVDGNGSWGGYVPDAWFRFDERGFDHAPDGRETGWRVFAYYPFLGTFFPTNGSTDDVLVRLPVEFRTRADGTPDRSVYETNLAIVEALVRKQDVAIDETDESVLGVDLDKDGRLGTATKVRFAWDPPNGIDMSFVGAAGLPANRVRYRPLASLFPQGTEFLHSVRYLDVVDGAVTMSARMKELRYARKVRAYGYGELEQRALEESREERFDPDGVEEFMGSAELGLGNGIGWVFQGFIEDRAGALRPQTFEEQVACIGCHSGVGATTDGVFAFPRRLDRGAFRGGWFHPTDHSLSGIADPVRADGKREYATYLARNGAGDELRGNDEVLARFFDANGSLRDDELAILAGDIGRLLYPSAGRAIRLDSAYRILVREQSFARGRDATITPVSTVHRDPIPADLPTGVAASTEGPSSLSADVAPR